MGNRTGSFFCFSFGLLLQNSRNEVVKELSLEYQRTGDSITFEKILKRVDNLVVFIILQEKKRCSFLRRVDLQELYQVAILGLVKAIKSLPSDENSNRMPARFKSYIRAELVKSFLKQDREAKGLLDKNWLGSLCSKYGSSDDVEIEIRDILQVAKRKGILTDDEYDILIHRFFRGEILKVVAINCHLSEPTIRKRINRALKKLLKFVGE